MEYSSLALEAHRQDRLADALRYYRLFLGEQPQSAEGWFALGMLYHGKIHDLAGARHCYATSRVLQPGNGQLHGHLGTLFAELGEERKALPYLRRAIADGGDKFIHSELACAHLRLGEISQARAAAAHYLSLQPDDYFAPYMAAWVALGAGEPREALRHVTDAVALDPTMPMPVALRGMLLWQLGQSEGSRQALHEMVVLQTTQIASGSSDGELLQAQRQWREIRLGAKSQLGVAQDTPVNFLTMGVGLGDQYIFVELLAAYKRLHPDIPLVVVSSLAEKWRTLYDGAADLFMPLDNESIFRLAGSNRMFPDHPYSPFFPWIGSLLNFYDLRQLSKFQLGLPQNAVAEGPKVPVALRQQAERMFHELGGKPGRSVLISNKSNSNPNMPDSWWLALIGSLQAAGFTLFQNTLNPRNPNPGDRLPGTIPVDVPIEQVIPFCEAAGFFIGMRSGLCDLLGTARVRSKAVYVKKRYPRSDRYPVSLWADGQSGTSLKRTYGNPLCDDISVAGDAEFDPSLLADWINPA